MEKGSDQTLNVSNLDLGLLASRTVDKQIRFIKYLITDEYISVVFRVNLWLPRGVDGRKG